MIYDFWTFCCANCMHILPSLAALEAKYAGQAVAVVGVHSAKFDNEKVGSNTTAEVDMSVVSSTLFPGRPALSCNFVA